MQYSRIYDKIYRSKGDINWRWHKYNLWLTDIVIKLIKRSQKKILDLGSGEAFMSHVLKKMGHDLVALDVSKTALRIAKEKNVKLPLICGCATHLPFKDTAFDCITTNGVIEHLIQKDQLKMLDEMKRTLKQNGTLVATTPNGKCILSSIIYYYKFLTGKVVTHLKEYDQKEFLNLIKRDFKIEDYDLIGGLQTMSIFSFLNPFLGLLKGQMLSRTQYVTARKI